VAADAVEAAAASVHVERIQGVLSLRRHRDTAPPKGAAKTEKGVRKEIEG
jgi:hypothetical protein